MMQSDESDPDFALVTRIRLGNAGEVLSVFRRPLSDRRTSSAYSPTRHLRRIYKVRIFNHAKTAYESAQIVFRVDYSRGALTGLAYITHRLTSAHRK
jgi:hypothetical protein